MHFEVVREGFHVTESDILCRWGTRGQPEEDYSVRAGYEFIYSKLRSPGCQCISLFIY